MAGRSSLQIQNRYQNISQKEFFPPFFPRKEIREFCVTIYFISGIKINYFISLRIKDQHFLFFSSLFGIYIVDKKRVASKVDQVRFAFVSHLAGSSSHHHL